MKMIKSVVYLYKKCQRLVFGRFQRTAGSGEPPGSGSKELLGQFTVSGRFLGTGGPGEPARGSLIRFKRFFPAVSRFRRLGRFGTCRERIWFRTRFQAVRFRVTRYVAITKKNYDLGFRV